MIGDSMVRPIGEHRRVLDYVSNFECDIHCYPGATIQSLRRIVYEDFQGISSPPDVVVLHVGTNTVAAGVPARRAVRQTVELVEAVRHKTQCGDILVSLILPRWDSEELYDSAEELNSLLKEQFEVVDCRGDLDEREYYDTKGLHVDLIHGHHFARVLGAKIREAVSAPRTAQGSTPTWWIPPLTKVKCKDNGDTAVPTDETKKRTSGHAPSWRTIRHNTRRMNVALEDGFVQIGFDVMPPSVDTKPIIPLPSGCMASISRRPTSDWIMHDLPKPLSPYLQRKKAHQKRARQKRRAKKAKTVRKNKAKVSIWKKKSAKTHASMPQYPVPVTKCF